MPDIGFIGLGRMGQAISLRLLEQDTPLYIYNRTAEKAKLLLEKGAVWCDSIPLIAGNCDIILLCLAGENATNMLLNTDEHGMLRYCRPGAIIIDTGTISPQNALSNQQKCETAGLHYVSCPVSGGAEGGRNGVLAAIVAVRPDLQALIEPVISRFANRISWVSSGEKAQQLKILNNLAESINLLGAFEVLNIGLEQGIALQDLHNVLTTCRGRSAYMDVALRFLSSNQQSSEVSLAVRCKDIRFAMNLMPVANRYQLSATAAQLFCQVQQHYDDEQDQCEYFNYINEVRN